MQLRHLTRQLLGPWLNRHPRLKAVAQQSDTQLDLIRHTAASVLPVLIQPQPRNLTVALTAYCNLRCVGCRYGRDFMPGAQLSWELVRDLLTDARAAGFESVRLYGGEPLLHPTLPRLVAHAKDLGLRVYITTNGLLLGEKIDELYEAGLRDVTIGFYGVGAHYDAYVQRKNRFAKLSESLSNVRARYGNAVSLRLNWLLMRPSCSVAAVREAWAFAQQFQASIQVDLIHYSLPYFTEGPERELQFRELDRPAINAVVAELLRLKQSHPEMLDQSALGLSSIADWLINREAMRVPCDKYQMIWVGADGVVQMCYVDFKLGNLHQQRFREMLFTPEHRAAARAAFTLQCPNCHCSYDARIQKHLPSRRHYARQLSG